MASSLNNPFNLKFDFSAGVSISSGWIANKLGLIRWNSGTIASCSAGSISIDGVVVSSDNVCGDTHHVIASAIISAGQKITATQGNLIFYPSKD